MTFELLEVSPDIIRALKEDGIYEPTKIQKLAIPLIKSGQDVIGMSNTGSGKTAAFGIPVLETIEPHGGVQVLVLVPTRELAVQIRKEFEKFSKYMHANICEVYGGVAMGPQVANLKKSEIVIATTGRLADHLRRGSINLSKLNCIVLDEADKMVDMGFINDIEEILRKVPNDRQVLLFGATISREIDKIKHRHMKQPQIAEADANVEEDFLEQYYYDVTPREKFSALVHFLKKEDTDRVMIFCSRRSTVEILTKNLKNYDIKAAMIHGKLTQNRRQSIIDGFNKDKPKILVASAVAARGLDIRNVTHIFNYDLSQDSQEYVHRVGRTARAGETGKAITFLESKDHDVFRQILANYDLKIHRMEEEEFEILKFEPGPRRNYGRGGPRGRPHRGGPRKGPRHGGGRHSRGPPGRRGPRDSRPRRDGQSSGSSSSNSIRPNRSGPKKKPDRRKIGKNYNRNKRSGNSPNRHRRR